MIQDAQNLIIATFRVCCLRMRGIAPNLPQSVTGFFPLAIAVSIQCYETMHYGSKRLGYMIA